MANASETLDQAQRLLKEGKVDEAAALMREASDEERAKEAAASGKEPPKKAPRSAAEIIDDLIREIASHIGNPPRVQVLLDELVAASKSLGL